MNDQEKIAELQKDVERLSQTLAGVLRTLALQHTINNTQEKINDLLLVGKPLHGKN